MRQAIDVARRGLVERESLVEAIVLAAVAGEHVLVVGPPGTAKSEAARRVAKALGGRTFEYLLGRFTEPNEIFGPVDLRRLREGVVEVETAGMLPEAEIAFLDEVFLGSTAILNTLLSLLNERVFRRGSTVRACPLRVCVGASNALPEDEALAAFADRFLLRCFVEPVADPFLEDLLEQGWGLGGGVEAVPGAMAALDELTRLARRVELGPVRPLIADAVRVLRKAGVVLPDRRVVRLQKLIAAATVLDGRTVATGADLWPIIYAVPTAEGQGVAREALAGLLRDAKNAALTAASAEASGGATARAMRIAATADELLALDPRAGGADPAAHADVLAAWLRRVEGVAREIDVCFAPDELPASLAEVRRRVRDALSAGNAGTP